ncbi:MAG: SusD/RagB family nutrient-binding outer membrane lipoprotein [Saprospiraceae bacterium]|nr:SusD/RagB family nutrient-binding outer membrane lipoprotein [Saprospiraceae bacterium]
MKLKYINFVAILLLIIGATSCKKYLDINVDPNLSTTSRIDLQLSTGQLEMAIGIGDRIYQQTSIWSQYTTGGPGVALGDWDKNTMGIADGNQIFRGVYKGMSNLSFITKSSNQKNYQVAAIAMSAYGMQTMVDLFGNVPYTQALKGDIPDGFIVSPAYDDAKTVIYTGLENDLKQAQLLLTQGFDEKLTIPGPDDLIYGKDATNWKSNWDAFCNTILLKLYLRQGESGRAKIQTLDLSNLILSNAQMAKVNFDGGAKSKNPFWTSAKSTSLGNYHVASKTTIDYLKSTADPRIDAFYNASGNGSHVGLKQGDVENSPATADYSKPNGAKITTGGKIFSPTAPVILVSAWETELLVAEAIARGWVSGDAKSHFENAVHLNMSYLGIDSTTTATYLNGSGIWDAANPIKSIAIQKWVCMNGLQPMESWIETRRFDSSTNPIFTSPTGIFVVPTNNVLGGNRFPSIFYYPESEQSLNNKFPGQHSLTDKVFWDN